MSGIGPISDYDAWKLAYPPEWDEDDDDVPEADFGDIEEGED